MNSKGHPGLTRDQAIPEQRDRLQSQILTWTAGLLLAAACLLLIAISRQDSSPLETTVRTAIGLSLGFGVAVWRLRAATAPAALCGAMVCFLVTVLTRDPSGSIISSGLVPLMLLFLLTFAATRTARAKGVKERQTEVRKGRTAGQVLANLGMAGLVCLPELVDRAARVFHEAQARQHFLACPILLAVLGQATADTMSSELGQAFGGQPRMIGSWRPAAPGTDGAITIVGTVTGMLGAMLITGAGTWSMHLSFKQACICWVAAVGGLFFDSLLGATVERKGWIGNDLVNFTSTAFAAVVAAVLLDF